MSDINWRVNIRTFFRKTHKLPNVIVDTFFDILEIAPVPARS